MAKQIKGKDIIENNHLSDAIKSAEEYLKVIEQVNKALDRTAKLTKKGAQATNLGKAEDIQKLNAALQKSQTTKKGGY